MRTKRLLIPVMLTCLVCVAGATEPESGIQTEVLLRGTQSWNGADLPDYPDGAPEITIAKITIPPGQALPLHRHPVINGGLVLAGELTVRTEAGRETHLRAGDALLEVVNTWHAGRNEGTEPTVALIFYAGTRGVPVTEVKPD